MLHTASAPPTPCHRLFYSPPNPRTPVLSKSAVSLHTNNLPPPRFKEIERRREAHKERERKKKESEVLAARLLEYAKHADEDEEEFGAPAAAGSSASTTAAPAAGQADAAPANADEGGDVAAVASDSTEVATADGTSSPSRSPSTAHEHQHQQETASGPVAQASEQEPCIAAKLPEAACQEEKDEGRPESAIATEGSAATAMPKPAIDREQSEATTTVSSPLPTSAAAAAAAMSPVAPAAPPIARPKVVRTYGRQKSSRDTVADGAAASVRLAASKASDEEGDSAAAVAAAALPVSGVRTAMTAESQALWQEDEDDQLESAGMSGPNLGEDSCVLSLGLDDEDFNDEDGEDSERESAKCQAVDGDAAAARSSPEEDGRQPEAGIKRKLIEVTHSGSDDAADAVDGTVPGGVASATAEVPTATRNSPAKRDNVMTAITAKTSFVKMKLTADGELGTASLQLSLSSLFRKGGDDAAAAESSEAATTPPSKKNKGIAAFFGATGEDASAASQVAVSQATPVDSTAAHLVVAAGSTSSGETPEVAESAEAEAEEDVKVTEPPAVESEHDSTVVPAVEVGEEKKVRGDVADDEQEEGEKLKEPKDRSAKYRAMLESDRAASKKAKKLRKSGMMDDEAEEEEEEEAVRGLGDFGFGVPAGGTGTSATGGGKKGADEEDDIDDEIREEVRVDPADVYGDKMKREIVSAVVAIIRLIVVSGWYAFVVSMTSGDVCNRSVFLLICLVHEVQEWLRCFRDWSWSLAITTTVPFPCSRRPE